jgi:hypothetical protein
MKFKIFTLFFFSLIGSSLLAQDISISGYIRDAASGEALIGATLFAPDLAQGTTTNEYGFYSLTFPATDTLKLVISFIGYAPQAKKLVLKESTKLDFDLDQGSYLEEVTVSANRTEDNVKKAQVGVINVPIQKIKQLPVIAGERDVFKVLQFLPGVQQAQEGTSGFLVRGGSIDQNLVQLDEAVVYNPNHLFGLFSTFNINALNNVQLIKGGFSPKYGGRLSSIVDMTMREGNKQTFEYEGGIGLLSANMTVEGPIKKDKASFIVSGRRSYLDLILAPFTPQDKKGTTYKFYDLNAKVNVELGKKDKLYLSRFSGSDNAAYTGANSINYGIDFGNQTGTLRWNHLFGNKLFSNTSFIVNNYHLSLGTTQGNYYAVLYTGIDDVNFKTDFTYIPNFKHTVKVGASYFYHTLYPASFSAKVPKKGNRISITKDSIPQRYSNEMAFYAGDEWNISPSFSINYGLRLPYFFTSKADYLFVEPRVITKFQLSRTSSLKASYTKMNQFLHLVPTSTASLPTDIWIPSSNQVKPQNSQQFTLGFFKNFMNNDLETSLEVYYKSMENQVLFKEGTQLTLVTNIEEVLTFGTGKSYGIELFVKKNFGKLSGWFSYTLSKTDQTFPDLNFGQTFPFTYDRRHNLSIAASYDLNDKWTISADFVFHTGNAFTLPEGLIPVYQDGSLYDQAYNDFSTRNNARLRAYHRLDVNFSYKKQRHFFGHPYESELVFGAYNLYSRQNPYFVYLTVDPSTNERKAIQVSLLPIIPSISYNFKF